MSVPLGGRRYQISASQPFGKQVETGPFVWRFSVQGTGAGRNGSVDLSIDEILRFGCFKNARASENDPAAVSRMNDAVVRFGLPRIQALLDNDAAFEGFHRILVAPESITQIVRLYLTKTCEYQLVDGRDLYCSAASSGDETVVGTANLRRLAPTSRPVCLACNLPSTDFICSHLSHVRIAGLWAGGRLERFIATPPLCDLGLPGVVDNATLCRAGGHACWRLLVSPPVAEPAIAPSPLGLADAFDHLDAIWQLALKGKRLLAVRRAADVAGLTLPCKTQEEFDSRMSDLIEVLKSLRVPDELVSEKLRGAPGDQSLNRLSHVMNERLPTEEKERANRAIELLRSVIDVRVAAQHSGASAKEPEGLASLGIDFPIQDYGAAWDRIRSKAVGALTELREALTTVIEP